jgi:hypothetical protein
MVISVWYVAISKDIEEGKAGSRGEREKYRKNEVLRGDAEVLMERQRMI